MLASIYYNTDHLVCTPIRAVDKLGVFSFIQNLSPLDLIVFASAAWLAQGYWACSFGMFNNKWQTKWPECFFAASRPYCVCIEFTSVKAKNKACCYLKRRVTEELRIQLPSSPVSTGVQLSKTIDSIIRLQRHTRTGYCLGTALAQWRSCVAEYYLIIDEALT